MRVNARGEIKYSPDDGDYRGFADLLKQWVRDMPIREADIDAFAQRWANMKRVNPRSPVQWLDVLKSEYWKD
jgi:hypothetical protein